MKHAEIRYSSQFPRSPISGWIGPRYGIWVQHRTASGQWRRPHWQRSPFFQNRKRWAQLITHLDGVNMVFATPQELDHFIDVMSQNPLPKGRSLGADYPATSLPNNHWLSRFPARGKSRKFREKAIRFLSSDRPAIREFRSFYWEVDFSDAEGVFPGSPVNGRGTYNAPYRLAQ
ncbi:MAG: hypothetical protein AAF771_00265 [Pseudomonadota bacterium]